MSRLKPRGPVPAYSLIADRSGYVFQGADAHLELARLACDDKTAARHHAEEAHRLATCDGLPDYTYAEAAALLAQLDPRHT